MLRHIQISPFECLEKVTMAPFKIAAVRVRRQVARWRCPRFRDWNEICKLGDAGNHIMMMKLALVDITAPDVVTLSLVEAFPQCFVDWEDVGAVPLSVIRALAQREAQKHGVSDGADLPVLYGSVPLHVHVQTFDKTRKCVDSRKWLPYYIASDASQGDIVIWEFREYMVIENKPTSPALSITPVNAVRTDI